MAYSRRRAEEAETEIGACLEPTTGGSDPCGAYTILKRWYLHTSAWAPNPFRIDMEKVRGGFQTFHHREETHTPGLPLATHIDPAKVNDKIPSEAELEAAIRRLCPHSAIGHTHLRAKHFKQ